jgi:hypothetical protein
METRQYNLDKLGPFRVTCPFTGKKWKITFPKLSFQIRDDQKLVIVVKINNNNPYADPGQKIPLITWEVFDQSYVSVNTATSRSVVIFNDSCLKIIARFIGYPKNYPYNQNQTPQNFNNDY